MVLIPDGKPSYCQIGGYRITKIERSGFTTVHAYRVDTLLGRITDNSNLHSKLFLCLLHAIISYYLPDQLTGLTRTEQALAILNSAAVKSFNYLSEANIELLVLIADLTPARNYYLQGQ